MSGIYSQFGFTYETTYGTYVAPDTFVKVKNWNHTLVPNRVQGEGIQSGRLGHIEDHHVETTKAGEASFTADVTTRKWGKLLQNITGGTSASVQNESTAAYTETHTLAKLAKFMTFQGGAPYRNATNVPMTIVGGKITSATFQCGVQDILSCDISVDGRDFTTNESLASASYVDDKPFTGAHATLKLGTYGSEAAVADVIKSMSLTFTRAMDTDNYNFGGGGLKSEPIEDNAIEITGSVDLDWSAASKAAFHDRFVNNESTSLVWEFDTGVAIEGAYNSLLRFTIPSIRFDGQMQGVDGKEALKSSMDFSWLDDGTNTPKIEYITADTAI